LLAAGAAAGMTATFGSRSPPVLLAVELLLFELRPRSVIPVALAAAALSPSASPLWGYAPLRDANIGQPGEGRSRAECDVPGEYAADFSIRSAGLCASKPVITLGAAICSSVRRFIATTGRHQPSRISRRGRRRNMVGVVTPAICSIRSTPDGTCFRADTPSARLVSEDTSVAEAADHMLQEEVDRLRWFRERRRAARRHPTRSV